VVIGDDDEHVRRVYVSAAAHPDLTAGTFTYVTGTAVQQLLDDGALRLA
jgi:hypothetical protein